MALYPPLVKTSLPAFPADTQNIKFYYSIPDTMSEEDGDITPIQYTIVNQENNKSVLSGNTIKGTSSTVKIEGTNERYFIINSSELKSGAWTPGTIYKVQIRFGNDFIEKSEWSSVCYLKATANSSDIIVDILNIGKDNFTVYTESPRFYGKYSTSDKFEIQKKYKFVLIDYNSGDILEDTGWKSHIEGDEYDSIVFSIALKDFQHYKLEYSIETKNGYIQTIKRDFICTLNLLNTPNLIFDKIENNYEEGCVNLHISSDQKISTNLILRRTDSKSNFSIWEDYKIFNIWDEQVDIDFIDFLVEHGVEYQYSIQTISSQGYRGTAIKSSPIAVFYEHMFLVGNNKQLKIKFNPKVSSWKRVLQESKVDTIGSKYPFIVRNGNVNYFTFPINGLISYHADEEELFCSKNSLCVSNQITTAIADTCNRLNAIDNWVGNTNLDDINIVLEREFRDKVEEFLTNGDYKYFKSPTEGTKIVAITGVSLTPEDVLGRMVYSFTSTAHEVGDNSLTNLVNLEVINAGQYSSVENMGEKAEIQIISDKRIYETIDLYSLMREKIEGEVKGTNYIRKLKYIKNVRIEVIEGANCIISIQQQSGGSWTSITIGDELKYYVIPDMIKVFGITAKPGGTTIPKLNITYDAVYTYQEKEISSGSIFEDNLELVSKFTQLYTEFSNVKGNMDLISAIKNTDNSLSKIYNFTFFRIDALPGTKIEIDGVPQIVSSNGSLEIRDTIIYSAKMISETAASISVIYNGGK